MASSCSTSLLAPSFPMKIVPYVPRAPKPKPKPKAKSMNTTKTAEHSRPGVGSSEDDGEWFHIDDFPMPDINASRSLDQGVPTLFGAADASSSLDSDVVGGLSAASESEKPEHGRSGRESLDGEGTDYATSVAKTNSALNGLFDGSSLEFPLIVEGDTAEEHYRTTQVKLSNRAPDYQGNSYHAAAGTEGYRAGQHGDLDAASVRALSVEDIEGIRHERLPAENESPFGDVDVTSRSPLTRKRTRRSSAGTIISPAEVPDISSEPELEDPRLAKRRRPAKQRAESLILDPASTPKSTPLPTSSGSVSCSRASNEPSPGPLNRDSQGGGAGSPGPPPNNLKDNGDDGAHARGTVEELHSARQSIPPFQGIEGDQDIDPGLERPERNRNGSSEAGESQEGELSQVDVSGRHSAKTSQRSRRSDRTVRERGGDLSRTALRRRGWSTMPTRTLRNVTLSQPRQLSRPRTDRATRSCSARTSSPGTKAGGTNNYGPSANMAYQITDLTHCHVPKGSSIVTAIVRRSESNLSFNPIALDLKLLGGEGKVIRMTQLSPDSWMLLGYRYDDGAPGACTRESPTLLNADWVSSPRSDAASHDTDHLDGDEEYEEGLDEYRPHAASSGQRFSRDHMRFCRRTRVPWLESDDLRLLAYRKDMDMEWKDIFELFPDRTPGAVRTRWHMLRGK